MSSIGSVSFKMKEYPLRGGERADYLRNQSRTLTDRLTQLQLTDESLAGLKSTLESMLEPKLSQKGTNIHESVLKHLEPLKKLSYCDKETFYNALTKNIANMTNIDDSDKKIVFKYTWRLLSRRRDDANIISRFEARLHAIEQALKLLKK